MADLRSTMEMKFSCECSRRGGLAHIWNPREGCPTAPVSRLLPFTEDVASAVAQVEQLAVDVSEALGRMTSAAQMAEERAETYAEALRAIANENSGTWGRIAHDALRKGGDR